MCSLSRGYYGKPDMSQVYALLASLISHQEGHGRVFLGEALHFLQHAAEDRHHPSLVLALCLERPLAAVLLKTSSRS